MTESNKIKDEYKIKSINTWDEAFFQDFVDIKNNIHLDVQEYLAEELTDIEVVLKLPYLKTNKVIWQATIISKNNVNVARVINFYDPNLPNLTYFGYLEFYNDEQLKNLLNKSCEDFCKLNKQNIIKGPINAHFFVSYRLKIKGDIHFHGEPDSLEYYHTFFTQNDYQIAKTWKTVEIDHKGMNKNFNQIKKKHNKKDLRKKDVSIKSITPWNFEKDIRTIYELFSSSYSNMSEFQPIDFESFYELYKDFKFVINPFFSFIIYYQEKPYAFNINLLDPLETIIKFKKKYKKPNSFQKLRLLTKIFFGNRILLFMHVGKIELENEPPIKGITSILNRRVFPMVFLFRIKKFYTCYLAQDSKSNDSFRNEDINNRCLYAIYQKQL
jgi:hypothetical protein